MPFKDKDYNREYQRNWERNAGAERRRKLAQNSAMYRAKLREQVLDALGGVCVGENCYGWGNDRKVLDIDHVFGDGSSGSRTRLGSSMRYLEMLKDVHSGRYQLLCCNCHRRKTLANGDHKRRLEAPNE